MLSGATIGAVAIMGPKDDSGAGAGVILFGKKGDESHPVTRPGKDGKVSCSSCSPEVGLLNSFGRNPEDIDTYFVVDIDKVRSNGGKVEFDGGSPIIDLNGNSLEKNYPTGHVS